MSTKKENPFDYLAFNLRFDIEEAYPHLDDEQVSALVYAVKDSFDRDWVYRLLDAEYLAQAERLGIQLQPDKHQETETS